MLIFWKACGVQVVRLLLNQGGYGLPYSGQCSQCELVRSGLIQKIRIVSGDLSDPVFLQRTIEEYEILIWQPKPLSEAIFFN